MSLLTQFYDCGGGGGLDGGRFAGGSYPGLPSTITGWPPTSSQSALGFIISSGGTPPGGMVPSQLQGGNFAMFTYSNSTTGSVVPARLTFGGNANLNLAGLEQVSFTNWGAINTVGAVFDLADVNPVTGAAGASTLKTMSGFAFTVGNTAFLNAPLPALETIENSRIGFQLSSTATFTTPLLSNIETCIFEFQQTGGTLSITNASLTAASVEKVIFDALTSETARGASIGGNINLSGGSSAVIGSLSPAAQAAITTLNGSGWVVTVNP